MICGAAEKQKGMQSGSKSALRRLFESWDCRGRIKHYAARSPTVCHFSCNVDAAFLALEVGSITSIKTATAIESMRIDGQPDIHNIVEIDNIFTGSPMEVFASSWMTVPLGRKSSASVVFRSEAGIGWRSLDSRTEHSRQTTYTQLSRFQRCAWLQSRGRPPAGVICGEI